MPEIVKSTDGANLADVLERVLDKGVVIAGDIRIKIVDVELLTISIRLLISSVDKAREIGIDWWSHSTFLCPPPPPAMVSGAAAPSPVFACQCGAVHPLSPAPTPTPTPSA